MSALLLASAEATAAPPSARDACEHGNLDQCAQLGLDQLDGAKPDAVAAMNLYERGCFYSQSPLCEQLYQRLHTGDAEFVLLLRAACDHGGLRACIDLGGYYGMGKIVELDHARAAALYERACNGGESRGCTNLGIAYQKGTGVAKDERRALALFEQACKGGSRAGCANAADVYVDQDGTLPKDEPKARRLYDQACQQGMAYACTALGNMYQGGVGGPVDDAKAEVLFIRACEGDDHFACANLSGRELAGKKLLARRPDLLARFQQACDDPAPRGGCLNLGGLYAHGIGVAKDDKRATELFKLACDRHQPFGCIAYAQQLMDGTPADQDRALQLLDGACQLKMEHSCDLLGKLSARMDERDGAACGKGDAAACAGPADRYWLSDGHVGDVKQARTTYEARCNRGVIESCRRWALLLGGDGSSESDRAKSLALLERTCNGKLADGCASLAALYAAGDGVARDPARALALEEQACAGGSARGCAHLGNAYGDGRFGVKDAKRASAAYSRGCKLDHMEACYNWGITLRDGDGTVRDIARAVGLFERTCHAGVALACASAASLYGAGEDVPRDVDKMRHFVELACMGGIEDACAWMKQNE